MVLTIIFGDPLAEYFAFFASVATVVGIISVWWTYRKRSVSSKWREQVVLDLIRHFFINNAISDAIRIKGKKPWPGVISRYATLQSDMELAKFSYDANFYSRIHRLSIFIRNYNSVIEHAERNLQLETYDFKQLTVDLKDLSARSLIITEELIDLCNSLVRKPFFLRLGCNNVMCQRCLDCYKQEIDNKGGVCLRHSKLVDNLTYSKVADFVGGEYSESKIEGWKKDGYYDDGTTIPEFEEKSTGEYYTTKLGLGDKYKDLVRYNLARLRFREE